MEKTLLLIRHAHRDLSDRDADNGLSEKGWEQAGALAEEFQRRFHGQDALLLSSPKARCRETLEPIAKAAQLKIEVDPRLNEQESGEGYRSFYERTEAFLMDWMEKGPELVVACSHGDWLPSALEILTGSSLEMKKGAWAEVVWDGKKAKLEKILQKLG